MMENSEKTTVHVAGRTLSARCEKFARNVASGLSQTAAYKDAYPTSLKWKEGVVASRASDMAAREAVRARIAELQSKVEQTLVWDMAVIKDAVLRDAWEVLHADAADLSTYRRLNCRFCYGQANAYQWRDEEEFWTALAAHAVAMESWDDRRGRPPAAPTDQGGYGWRRLAPPNPACGRCEGEGLEEAHFADVRRLSGPARRLYAGVEVKKGGAIKIHTRDKEAARALLANYAGVVRDKLHLGGVVGVTPLAPAELTDQQRAALQKALEDDV